MIAGFSPKLPLKRDIEEKVSGKNFADIFLTMPNGSRLLGVTTKKSVKSSMDFFNESFGTLDIFFATIWFLSRGRALGFGDAKLGLSIGLLLGAAQGFSAIVMAFWIGAAVSLLYLFIRKSGFIKSEKELTIKSEVPFAPFLIMGAWLSLIFDLDILHVLSFQTFL